MSSLTDTERKLELFSHVDDELLDWLVDDNDHTVREKVARYGRPKDLDRLVKDYDPRVRFEVVRQGRDKDLNKLVYDEDEYVRELVARYGRDKDLNILVYDTNGRVVLEVLEHERPQDIKIIKERLDNDEIQHRDIWGTDYRKKLLDKLDILSQKETSR